MTVTAHKMVRISQSGCFNYQRLQDAENERNKRAEERASAEGNVSKREEGGRMDVSQLDVSMNAPIRHQRPRHPPLKNALPSPFG